MSNDTVDWKTIPSEPVRVLPGSLADYWIKQGRIPMVTPEERERLGLFTQEKPDGGQA